MKTVAIITLLCLCCLTVSCDESEDSADPEQTCIDIGHELSLAGERCGLWTYADGQNEWQKLVGGDCSKTTSIRDQDEVYEQCIPWLQSSDSCTTLSQGTTDSSCKNQVLH